MEILKTATNWAKAEIFSTQFFIFFGILFLISTLGFWKLGKTELAKAFILPTLIAGILLLIIGFGLFFNNKSRLANLEANYTQGASAFVQSEIVRTKKTMDEYQTIVFKVIPVIIAFAALAIVFLDKPIWRAISITTIAFMIVLLLVDSNANARMEAYQEQLLLEAT